MGFRDGVAGDGVGGWTDEGDNDMRGLPVGPQTFNGVPFDIIDPATNDAKSCITLSNTRRDGEEVVRSNFVGTTSVKDIPVGGFLCEIHLLVGCALSPLYSGWAKPTVARVTVAYEDGTERTFAIEYNRHVTNWWTRPPEDLPAGKVAWVGTNPRADSVAIYQCVWANPFPDRRVSSVSFHQGFQCPSKTPVFVAATGRTIELVE
jgi:beta-galactosidase